jgi:hypothetical protein
VGEVIGVFVLDYVSDDSGSPDISERFENETVFSPLSEISNNENPEIQWHCLEDTRKVKPLLKLINCHLASQTKFPELKSHPDNVIYGSRDFHDYFDGMAIESKCPELAVEYLSHDERPTLMSGFQLYKFYVRIKFRRVEVANCMLNYFKDGTQRVNELEFTSFLFMTDPVSAQRFLAIKLTETMKKWNDNSIP